VRRWYVAAVIAALLIPSAGAGVAAPSEPTVSPAAAVLVGDSIVSLQLDDVIRAFSARNVTGVRFEAFAGRAIDRPMYYPSVGWVASGVSTVRAVRAAGVDAPLWVVELGANDLSQFDGGRDGVASARRLIDAMRAEIGPRTIAWATVQSAFWPQAVAAFNQALYDVAAIDPNFLVIDWYSWSLGRPWFTDHVHLNDAGGAAIGRCLAGATQYALALVNPPAASPAGLVPAARLGVIDRTRLPDCWVLQ
jgi:hypothetical protein